MARLFDAWRDPDKRRALLLAVTIHLVALLLMAAFLNTPKPRKLDQYVVVTLGSPKQAESQTQAPTSEAAAPQAAAPQVASGTIGQPQARSAPQERAQAPEPQQETAQPPPPTPNAPAAPQQAPQPAAPRQPPASPQAPQQQTQAAAPATPSAQAPAPELHAPSASQPPPQTPADTSASVLPEIKPPVVPPKQIAPSVTIPEPQARAQVPQATSLAIAPEASVSASQRLNAPQASAQVAAAQPLSAPQASAQVPAARAVPTPEATATVPRPVTAPQASAQVAAAQPLSAPRASAQVSAPRELSAPTASAQVARARPLTAPQASATAGSTRDVAIAPQVAVTASRPVPVPTVRAEVTAATASAGAPARSGAPPGNSDVATNVTGDHTPGGNASTAGQVGGEVQANAAGRGNATSPDGTANGAGGGTPSPAPFREELERPLAVLVDNVHGYPQSGLKQASTIIEMPVEGGLTRLMLVYDNGDPGKVGPIRSARDYFVSLSQSMNAVLVHDGGSPGAIIAIKRASLPTLDALHRNDLFVRGGERSAPYNLYSEGGALRRAVNRLLPARTRVLTGTLYQPPKSAPTVTSVTDRFSKDYKTGFRYFPKLDTYRWVRDGTGANDASGENVLVDAVLLAKIDATPLPDDPEGRLYIPLQGGPATLYLHGQAVAGHWQLGDGVQFFTEDGKSVDVAPFRIWVVMTPTYDQRVEQ